MQLPETLSINLIFGISSGFVLLMVILAVVVLKDAFLILKIRRGCLCEADATLVDLKHQCSKSGKGIKSRVKGVYEVFVNGSRRRCESAIYGTISSASPVEGSKVKILIDPSAPQAVYDPFVSGLLRRNIITAIDFAVFAVMFGVIVLFLL